MTQEVFWRRLQFFEAILSFKKSSIHQVRVGSSRRLFQTYTVMSLRGMEYQIDPENDKKVQVQTVDNELILVIE